MSYDEMIRDEIDKNEKRIEALEKRVEELYKSVHGIAPDQADELKELLNEVAQAQIGEIEQIKEVLRELLERCWDFDTKDLLEKLDGKTEKKEDSGGEKTVKVDSNKPIVKDEVHPRFHTDSKPPEPNYTWCVGICPTCEDIKNCQNPKAKAYRKEPREDEPMTAMERGEQLGTIEGILEDCVLTLKKHGWFKNIIVVKREDLQWMIDNLELFIKSEKGVKSIKRIKEVYGIE